MKKINLLNDLSAFYKQPKNHISQVELPPMNYLMIDGHGGPNDNAVYSDSVAALYGIAYHLKFDIKKGPFAIDFKVMPLEGLWWAEDMAAFTLENRTNWLWTMMIMQPDFITQEMVADAIKCVQEKKENPMLARVRLDRFSEGLCMQIFHQGPYGEGERATIEKLHAEISKEGYALSGKHHEIYFNSPLRTAPENLKTIIRQPIIELQ